MKFGRYPDQKQVWMDVEIRVKRPFQLDYVRIETLDSITKQWKFKGYVKYPRMSMKSRPLAVLGSV